MAQTHKDNAWFVGFAPRDNPEIVVAALFENGEHGQLAAPIVRDVIKAYFDKKARLAQPPPQIAHIPTGLFASAAARACRHSRRVLIPNMPAHRSLRDFDWLMLILVCAICALGVLQIYSATRDTHFTEAWWKQAHLDPGRIPGPVDRNADRLSHLARAGGGVLWPFGGHADRHLCRGNDRFRLAPLDWLHPAIIFSPPNSLNW